MAWGVLMVVCAMAVAAVRASVVLRDHSEARREITNELGDIETLATAQSALVWRALTYIMAEERMSFVKIRGEEQRARGEIIEHLEALRGMEQDCEPINLRLGFEPDPELMEQLDGAAMSFLSGVQGALGQMNLPSNRIRQRLKYWDMNYGGLQEALAAVKTRDAEIAKASTLLANQVTAVAALVTLLAMSLFVLRLSVVRSRRERDLQAERLRTTKASEARFRELVQHSSDLIMVLETDGTIRYATPSAKVLTQIVGSQDQDMQAASEQALQAARAIEKAVLTGSLETADLATHAAQCAIEHVMGLTIEEFLANENSEVAVIDTDGRSHIFDVHASDLTKNSDVRGIVLNARDITERKILEEQLRHQAMHDPLTNLPNRRQFKVRFDGVGPEEREYCAVMFIDLDGFKLVNDSYGHKLGDQLLIATASRLGSCLGPDSVLARQGGDEFLVLLNGEDPAKVAASMQAALDPPFQLNDIEVFVSASMGIVCEVVGLDSDQAAQRADIAMYMAKQAGKAQAVSFAEEMLDGAPERLALETDFRNALDRGEFTVYYQPKVGLHSRRTESLEALVRWIHPTRGFVGPDTFIPFAEETGLISELGRQVLEQACMDAVRWQDQGVVVAVNLSPVQFRNSELINEVKNALEQSGLDPRHLELEITESAVLGDLDNTIKMLAELKALGIKLAIDDFGTGYSNLSHLKHFNVDVLKIDQSFVRGGNPSAQDHLSDGAIVKAVIGMAKAFGLHVVAEGVETEFHASELCSLGADLGQGYYFSKPVTAEGIDEILLAESQEIQAS